MHHHFVVLKEHQLAAAPGILVAPAGSAPFVGIPVAPAGSAPGQPSAQIRQQTQRPLGGGGLHDEISGEPATRMGVTGGPPLHRGRWAGPSQPGTNDLATFTGSGGLLHQCNGTGELGP